MNSNKVRFDGSTLFINIGIEIKKIIIMNKKVTYKIDLTPHEIRIFKILNHENIKSKNPFISYINALTINDIKDIKMFDKKLFLLECL